MPGRKKKGQDGKRARKKQRKKSFKGILLSENFATYKISQGTYMTL